MERTSNGTKQNENQEIEKRAQRGKTTVSYSYAEDIIPKVYSSCYSEKILRAHFCIPKQQSTSAN